MEVRCKLAKDQSDRLLEFSPSLWRKDRAWTYPHILSSIRQFEMSEIS